MRKFIRLSKVNKKGAQGIAYNITAIVSAKVSGSPLETNVVEWLSTREDWLYEKFAKAGLVRPTRPPARQAQPDLLHPPDSDLQPPTSDLRPPTSDLQFRPRQNSLGTIGGFGYDADSGG